MPRIQRSFFSVWRTTVPLRRQRAGAYLMAGVALLVMQAIPCLSQSVTATVTDRVLDSTGSVIAGARVSIVNQTGVLAWTEAGEASGNYAAPQIPVGTCSITAEHPVTSKNHRLSLRYVTPGTK